MAVCVTPHFGRVEYSEDSVVRFDEGIPAFPAATRFILIEPPEVTPLLYLQCLTDAALCFLTIPVECLLPGYCLHALEEDLLSLGEGSDYLCLAILTVTENQPPTANLMSPVVINRASRRARQVIQLSGDYSFTHPLLPAPPAAQEEPLC